MWNAFYWEKRLLLWEVHKCRYVTLRYKIVKDVQREKETNFHTEQHVSMKEIIKWPVKTGSKESAILMYK